MKTKIFIGVCIWFFLCGCVNNNRKSNQGLPVIDLTKNYPEKEFIADEADKEYIPLETTDDVLADRYFFIKYVSDQRIVGTNGMERGDILIFDGNGKVVSFFNHRGGSNNEYTYIISIVFDEKAKEVFVSDIQEKNRCLVYSEDGTYLRQFNYPDSSRIGALYDFDAQTLLAYNGYFQEISMDNINQRTPYVFLSKKDGSVVSRLDDISFTKRISNTRRLNLEAGFTRIGISTNSNIQYGQEFIIADMSSDTVFVLTQDKKLTPLLVRTPSVFADEDKLTTLLVYFKTDAYLFFLTFTYDWNEIVALINRGQQQISLSSTRKVFAYDLRTGQIYSVKEPPPSVSAVDVYGKAAVNLINADDLVDRLEDGTLDGKLKQVAQKIDADDNPVLEIIKYNEK